MVNVAQSSFSGEGGLLSGRALARVSIRWLCLIYVILTTHSWLGGRKRYATSCVSSTRDGESSAEFHADAAALSVPLLAGPFFVVAASDGLGTESGESAAETKQNTASSSEGGTSSSGDKGKKKKKKRAGKGAPSGSDVGSGGSNGTTSSVNPEDLPKCKASLQFTPSMPARDVGILDFCLEHAEHTCCERPHTNRIKSKIHEHGVEFMTVKSCATLTRQALCSYCDGDVGTGLLSVNNTIHICPVMCGAWFESCKDTYWLRRMNNELVPCNNDVGCRILSDLAQTSVDFCESAFSQFHKMEVANPSDEPDLCYDGVPSSRFKKGVKATFTDSRPNSQSSRQSTSYYDRFLSRPFDRWYRYLRYRTLPYFGPYLLPSAVTLLCLSYFLHKVFGFRGLSRGQPLRPLQGSPQVGRPSGVPHGWTPDQARRIAADLGELSPDDGEESDDDVSKAVEEEELRRRADGDFKSTEGYAVD